MDIDYVTTCEDNGRRVIKHYISEISGYEASVGRKTYLSNLLEDLLCWAFEAGIDFDNAHYMAKRRFERGRY